MKTQTLIGTIVFAITVGVIILITIGRPVLQAPPDASSSSVSPCPPKTTPCKNEQGILRDCCSSDEFCRSWGQCFRKGKCPPGTTPCINSYWNGAVACCTNEQYCFHGRYCAPKDCTGIGEPCKNNLNEIVCCVDSFHTCENSGQSSAYCKAKTCEPPNTPCGSYSDTEQCCTPTEYCVIAGGPGNTPICLAPYQPGKTSD